MGLLGCMFNEQSLKDKLKNKSKEIGVPFNNILIIYIFEQILKRLSKSNRRNNVILKGGTLVCSIYGLEKRLTTDIDFSLQNENLNKDNVTKILFDIININLNDGLSLSLINLETINNINKTYGGLKAKIAYKFDKIKGSISIDIVTGDTITPSPIMYSYKTILDDDNIDILSYNLETIIAEKLESILKRGVLNGRMKDYYDLYITSKYRRRIKIDEKILKSAIANTFNTRNYKYDNNIFESIKNSKELQQLWKNYSTNKEFVNDITFEEVTREIEQYINLI